MSDASFQFGGIGPVTGDAAIYGQAVMNGAQIAVDEIPAAGGVRAALGGSAAPKEISEAEGYSSVVIDIEANSDGRVYSLERSLHGGEVLCKTDEQPDRVLSAKHQAGKEDTVSQFLLDLSGLGTKKVR